MRQAREHLSLAAKAVRDAGMRDRPVEEFDCAPALEAAVRPGREPHLAHSAAADQLFDLVRTNLPARENRA